MKSIFFTVIMLLLTTDLFGQYDPRENFYDAEFFLSQEDYKEALYAYTQVYNAGYQDNANINYRIGICLLNIDQRKSEAIPYLEKAVLDVREKYKEGNFNEEGAPREALLYLANAYRINNQFEAAIKYYNAFLDYGEIKSDILFEYANTEILSCKKAMVAMEKKHSYKVGTLGQINEIRVPVYQPAISGDLSTIAFMGRQKFYNGVYISKEHDGKWTKPYNITPSIQSDGNQAVLSLSYTGDTLLLSWSDGFESDIWMTEFKNNRWNHSFPISKPVNSRFFESHACFSPDGQKIYFTSNRKESLGGMDIFRSTRNADGSWGDIELLGSNVNTNLNEESPYISPDGKKLFFSSQGHNGIGGYDVFYCEIMEDGTFGKPVNLDYPLNTSDDDFTFQPEIIEFKHYLTIYSKGFSSQVDVLRLEWIPESAQPIALDFNIPVDAENAMAELKDEIQEVADTIIEKSIEADTVKQIAEVVGQESIDRTNSKLPNPADAIGELKMIRPVYFGFDDYSLSPTAKKKLDEIVRILNKFQSIKMEIVGHTDAIGAVEYNQILSQRRAKSVADYLVEKGIKEERLKVKGVGESDHIAVNRTPDNHDSPQGRALNRRVHFNTTLTGGALLKIEAKDIPDNLKL